MFDLDLLTTGFGILLAPKMLFLVVLAVALGTLFGALPGVSATMAVTLGIPFTYSMTPVQSIVFLVAIYCASITGGGMTAILFKIPGVPSSAPTTYDGYPMAQRGEAGKALGIQLISSAIGGLFAALAMLLLCGPLTTAAVSFGPAELFAIAFLGLSILTSLDTDNICRTIISGLIGLLLACVGLDPLLGVPRLTFGFRSLNSGFEMIPIMIGFFAVTEVLKQTVKRTQLSAVGEVKQMKTVFPSFKELWLVRWVMARCSILGTVIGILPGAGATIAAFMCYSAEQKLSRHPEKFGTGCIEGIVAPEASNNAATGGSMVPLLSLGIPGGNAAAIMMSALVLKGVQMGPMLLVKQPEFLSATFASMFFANIVMVLAAIILAKIFVQVLRIPYSTLGPMIIMMATIGAFATKNIGEDVITMAVAGLIGFVIISCKFDISAMILGLVLGKICESNIRRAYIISPGETLWETTCNVFTEPLKIAPVPLTAILVTVCFLVLVSPGLKKLWDKRKAARS
ncbi:MAG: tripartite tricarboxylate transporter permease [Candidatus Accumulibacter sp.]|jgi:putative tricarboxylic transport membrane protein|nr:tripartite tricarboxylate transporter permease [Accumulibacter sp.]